MARSTFILSAIRLPGLMASERSAGGSGAGTAQHYGVTLRNGQRDSLGRKSTVSPEICWQAPGDTGAACDQLVVGNGCADRQKIAVIDCGGYALPAGKIIRCALIYLLRNATEPNAESLAIVQEKRLRLAHHIVEQQFLQ
ncbi:hypothetical protein [Phyllobacterium sp. SB3]|uniref:hypothetical protein n=1 Tax=Phyllobacterium sp. SB3 TaxID=3156073 RepID=UPI0032B01989